MDSNMLINLYRIFVNLRTNINNPKNVEIIEVIADCINEKKDNEKLLNLLCSKYDYINQLLYGNGYIVIDNNNISEFIISMLTLTKISIIEENYELSYDAIDLIHFLPELMINYDQKQLKKYWNRNVRHFSKKWKIEIFKRSKQYFVHN